MAARKLSVIQPTQIQNKSPSFFLRSGRSWTPASSTISFTSMELLTADPRVDDIDDDVKGEVDEDDPDRHDEHDPLDDEVVTQSDGRDQGVPESGDAQEVLDDESTSEEAADIDARRT